MGPRSYDEIKHIMHEADVVLHVESFDEKSIETENIHFQLKSLIVYKVDLRYLELDQVGLLRLIINKCYRHYSNKRC